MRFILTPLIFFYISDKFNERFFVTRRANIKIKLVQILLELILFGAKVR